MNDQNQNALSTQVAGERGVSTWLTPQSFEKAMQIAELMAKCGTLPQHLQGKPSDCFRIVVQAAKWQMDPFVVGECTSMVYGRLCYEGKLVAAVLKVMNVLEGRLDYDIEGEGPKASIVVSGMLRGEVKPRVLKGTVEGWRTITKTKEGQIIPNAWDKTPEDMLIYRGTRQWCRRYAPEAMMGISTPDEMDDVREAQDVRVTGTEMPEAKAPRQRGKKADLDGVSGTTVTPTGQEPATTTGGGQQAPVHVPTPDPRLATLLNEGKALHESGQMGAASLRAVLNQLGVTRLQNVPIVKLDAAIEMVRHEAKVCNVTLPTAPAAVQQQIGGAA